MTRYKKIIIITVAVIIVAAAAFYLFGRQSDEQVFRTEKLTKGDIQETVTATGTVNAVVTVMVGTQVSGTIKVLYVDYNSPVKKGQLLAQIDPATFQAQVDQAKANVLAARANVTKLQANTADAKRTRDRNSQLFSKNLIARSDLDTAEANYDAFVAQVDAAKAQVAQTEASLNAARINLQYTRILSPVDGVVVSRNVDVGQTVAASFQTPTLFLIAQDLTKMEVDTTVNEADIGKVKEGQFVEFSVDAYPEIIFKGKVFQVRNAPITVQNVVTYTVVIQVDNKDLKLRPGMTANASITTSLRKDVMRLPNAALRFRMPEKAAASRQPQKGPGIWILADGTPKRVKVTTGISDGTYTEVVSSDLQEGMDVIVELTTKEKKAGAPATGSAPGGGRAPRMF